MDSAESNTTMQKVVEMTKASLERMDSPLLWSIEVARCLENAGLEIPSPALAHALASCLFTCCPLPSLSAYLHHAMSSQLVSSFHLIGLLTPRVLQARRSSPEVYSLFLDLASTYIFHLGNTKAMPCCDTVVQAVDEVCQLCGLSGVSVMDFGTAAVQFVLILFWRLMEVTLEDWRTFYGKSDKQDKTLIQLDTTMEVDEGLNEQQMREREHLQKTNWITAINLAAKMLQNKKTFSLLRLAQRTSLKPWGMVNSCFQSLDGIITDALPLAAIEALANLLALYQRRFSQEAKGYQFPVLQVLIESRAPSWQYGNCSEVGRAAAWLPFDIFMEDVMVGTRIIATSVVEALAELVKSLQSILNASWHDTFLALWISAVRLPQREMENMEGPRLLFGSRLSMPLSIVPLASVLLIEEEEKLLLTGSESSSLGTGIEKDCKILGERRAAFVSSLKVLGQFDDLLTLPQRVVTAGNQAAAAAGAAFIAGFNHGSMAFESVGITDGNSGFRAGGNLRHLIVETCIARGLLDTSAYFWPGYVGAAGNNIPRSVQAQVSPWKLFMDGAPLNASLRNSLVSTPARSVTELEKIFHIAISGPEEERPAAASILCGASLMRSWNVQEHTVRLVIRLLSPPASNDGKLNGHHLIQHAPMLYATLGAIHMTDVLHVLSLYGRTFEVAAGLLPICEVFGSLSPTVPLVTGSKEEISVLTLFSLAFLILIKICKFQRAPLEHWTTGSGLDLFNNTSLEYLLVRYNTQVVSSLGISSEKKGTEDIDGSMPSNGFSKSSTQTTPQYVSMDSFPRLQAWFCQQKSCITTCNIPGVASVDSVHQVGDRLLAMMLNKANKSGNMPTTSGASVSSTVNDDGGGKPLLPAWDLLAAVPFVVDTLLTALGHGKLLPRDLTTGLRELVDFCPASLASIISFLEAEVTRGISRPAPMNGKDWPSPAANLLSIEAEIREMLSSSGVDAPSCVTGSNSGNILVNLPLPLAALLSLTITFKVDNKFSELVISVGGPALQNIAGGTACTSVVAALWSQKVRRWHDFIVFGSAVAAMKKDKTVASQVLKSCFSVTLGTTNNLLTSHGGVGALLGHTNWMHPPSGGRGSIPPGILFLRICPSLHDIMFLPSEIIMLLVKSVRDVSAVGSEGSGSAAMSKSVSRLRCLQSSLATTVSRVTQAATLSASLLFVSGGSTLGQLLYNEALPAWFLSGQKLEGKPIVPKSGNTALLEGYAVAYFAVLSGVLVWGGASEPKEQESVKMVAISTHMRFLASALDGTMSLACDLTTWKAYVTSFISLVLTCASSWIMYVDVETLQRIAVALRTWHDYDLALALLESGGTEILHIAGEFALSCL